MPVLLLIALLFLPQAMAAQAADITPVKLTEIHGEDRTLTRQFLGRVSARSTVDLAFQTGGQLIELPVSEGARVGEGELLAQLDLDPFRRELARAEANLSQAERDLARSEALGRDTVPQAQIDATRTEVELARVAVDDAEATLRDATLSAPFDAVVAERQAERYATVSAGQGIVRIHDMSELRVEVQIPEVLFRGMTENPTITAQAHLSRDLSPVPLVFRELTSEASDMAQTFRLTLAFDGTVPPHLLPGASVTVDLTLAQPGVQDVLVPVTAVRYAPDGTPQVLVFRSDAETPDQGIVTAEPVDVTPGPDGMFRLTSFPPAGSEIVAAGASRIEDGAAVRRYEGLMEGDKP